MARVVTLAVEGITDAAVAKRLLTEVGLQPGPEYVKNGKDELDRRLIGYNNAAGFSCWLVLRDLDRDAGCAPELRQTLLPMPAAHMRFHIVVHAIEAWLIADDDSISRYLSVARSRIPADPDAIERPKYAIVELARQSRRRAVREALVPEPKSSASVGPGYASTIIDFATNHWRPSAAEAKSESLQRLCRFLRRVASESDDCVPT